MRGGIVGELMKRRECNGTGRCLLEEGEEAIGLMIAVIYKLFNYRFINIL
jgi:hypothetical protein